MRALKVASVGSRGPAWPMRRSQGPGPEVSSAIEFSPLFRTSAAKVFDLPALGRPACSLFCHLPARAAELRLSGVQKSWIPLKNSRSGPAQPILSFPSEYQHNDFNRLETRRAAK